MYMIHVVPGGSVIRPSSLALSQKKFHGSDEAPFKGLTTNLNLMNSRLIYLLRDLQIWPWKKMKNHPFWGECQFPNVGIYPCEADQYK